MAHLRRSLLLSFSVIGFDGCLEDKEGRAETDVPNDGWCGLVSDAARPRAGAASTGGEGLP